MTDTRELLILIADYRRAIERTCSADATAAQTGARDDYARLRRAHCALDDAEAALVAAVVPGVEPAPLRLVNAIERRGPGITR
jgi:hypothetical protein